VIVVSPNDTGIRGARAKTDRLDARTLARLLAAGELDPVWVPDRATWRMRRRLQRRGQLIGARSRAKNQIHATLMRSLVGRAPFSDLFGAKGRRWLSELEFPEEECESVDSAMRQIEFLDREIDDVERQIAKQALDSAEIRRLMTVPGVNVIVAATFLAAIGDIGRFESPRKLVGYLGLDPRVRQSGSGPATHGRISKQGSMRARHALVVLVFAQPGAGLRLRAAVADAQEAAQARADRGRGKPAGEQERPLGRQRGDAQGRARARRPGGGRLPAERSRLARSPGQQGGRERDTGTRIFRPSERQAARQGIGPRPCALARRRSRPRALLQGGTRKSNPT
jgi:transposase